MASSQAPVHVVDVPVPAQFAQLTMGESVVFSTESQSPCPGDLDRLFVPIISIDHLSEDFLDLPVDKILALGDQALLRRFQQSVVRQFQPSRDRPSQLHSTPRKNQSQSFGLLQLHQMNESEMIPPMHGSESSQMQPMRQFDSSQHHNLLSEHIDEPDVFGPLVNNLYDQLASLETRQSCEFLLYLSGHGIDPDNVCLVPDIIKPHPARADLQERERLTSVTLLNVSKSTYVRFTKISKRSVHTRDHWALWEVSSIPTSVASLGCLGSLACGVMLIRIFEISIRFTIWSLLLTAALPVFGVIP